MKKIMFQSPTNYNSHYNSTNNVCELVDVDLNTTANLEHQNPLWRSSYEKHNFGAASASSASSDFIEENFDQWNSSSMTANCNDHSSIVNRIQNYVNSREKEKFKRFSPSDVQFPFNLPKCRRSDVDGVDDHVKRPMNGFMVFSQNRRKQLALLYPSMHNAELSKILGNEWKSMKQNDKQYYMLQALSLQKQHSIKHPDYKYRPKRRKNVNDSTKAPIGTEIEEKMVEEMPNCAKSQTAPNEILDDEHNVAENSSQCHPQYHPIDIDLSKNDVQQSNSGAQNQWYTCLRDIYDLDKEEFSQYFPD